MAESGPVAFYARRLARNVLAGLKLAFFLPLREHEFRVSPVDYAVLAGASFVAWILAAAVDAGFTGEFDEGAITVFLATVALVLCTALLLAQAYHRPGRLLLFAVALTAADPLFELAGAAVPALGDATGAPQLTALALLAWNWLAAVRVVLVCGGRQRPQLYQGVFAVSAMMAVAFYLLPRTDVWVDPEEDEREEVRSTVTAGPLKDLSDEPHQRAGEQRAGERYVVDPAAQRYVKVAGQPAEAAPAQRRIGDR